MILSAPMKGRPLVIIIALYDCADQREKNEVAEKSGSACRKDKEKSRYSGAVREFACNDGRGGGVRGQIFSTQSGIDVGRQRRSKRESERERYINFINTLMLYTYKWTARMKVMSGFMKSGVVYSNYKAIWFYAFGAVSRRGERGN